MVQKRNPSEPDDSSDAGESGDDAADDATDRRAADEDEVLDAVFDDADGASDDAEDDSEDAEAEADERPVHPRLAKRASREPEVAAATQLGSTRFVIFGFFAAWLVGAYVAHKALEGIWGSLGHREWFLRALPALAAVPHEGELVSRSSVTLVLGALLAGIIVLVYYRKPDVRQWVDEVAEQVSKVKWPTRKDVGNNTVVVIAVGAVLAIYLSVLDRFWGFLTNLFYTSGL